jgi:hypothetical protein
LTRNDTSPSINFSSIYYPTPSNCPNNFSALGSSVSNYYTVNINGNLSIYNCSGNVININNIFWAQNTSNSSQTIDSQHINETIRILRNDTGPSNSLTFNISYLIGETIYTSTTGFDVDVYPDKPENILWWNIPSAGNTTIFKAYGDGVVNTPSNWQQNLTAQSSVSNVYLNQSLYLWNYKSFALNSLNYSSSDWSCSGTCTSNCPSGFTCLNMSGMVNLGPEVEQTRWAKASGDVINESQTNWTQNTSSTNNLTTQNINSTVKLNRTDGSNLNFTNIQYSGVMQCTQVGYFSGDTVLSSYYVPITNNTSYFKCSGDVLNETWKDWQQDWIQTTIAGSTTYTTRNISIQNNATNPYLNFTNIETNWISKNRTSPWNCTGQNMINVNYNSWNNISMIMNCSADNIITKEESSWSADNSTEQNITYQKIIKRLNGTNTDSITYSNVNATYTSKSGYGNYNVSTPFTISSITANGGTWEKGISATNNSSTINTTWTNKYTAPNYYQNISINDTGDVTFFNLTGWSLNFDDINITAGTEYIRYLSGTQWIYITPSSAYNDCNTSSSTYTSNSTVNGTFYVCKKDLNGNGKIDYFKFKIPHTSAQILQVGGLDTTYPQYNINGTNTSIPNYRKAVLIYTNWSDDVDLDKAWLWTNEAGGIGKNYTDGTYGSPIDINLTTGQTWSNFTWQNISIPPRTLISWKIYANDTAGNQNVTEGSFRIWGWANVTEINISNLFDVNKLNRTVNAITCRVMDANLSTPLENYPVNFYKNDSLKNTSLTNATGYVVWYYNSTPDLGPYILKCNITDNETLFYNDSVNQMNSTVYIWRKLYLNLIANPTEIYRHASFSPDLSIIQAYFYDDNSTNITNKQLSFYRYYPGYVLDDQGFLDYRNTGTANGIATYNYNASSLNGNSNEWPPQNYSIYVNHSSLDYSYSVENTTNLLIKGRLNPNITSPTAESRYYKNQIVNLNSTTIDEYDNPITQLNITNWTLIEADELLNQSANGQWNISANHASGNFTVNYSVSKDWYVSNWTTKNISIFGYSAVNETGSDLVYRGSSSNYTGFVYDYQNNSGIPNYNCIWWRNNTNVQNTTTNSSGYCIWIWDAVCPASAGPYFINVSIGNNTTLLYDAKPENSMASISVNLRGNLSTLINIPSLNAIWHRGDNASVNSTIIDDCNNNFDNSQVTVNWYLDNLNASGINSTISIPVDYSKGPKTLITNVTGNYYVNGNNSTTIYIYGWTNITNITPAPQTVPRGTIVPVVCHVKDANTSENIENYNVSFYKNDVLNVTNITNSSGYAIWNWNTINDEPGINYTINCSISNNETLFYNATYPSQLNTTIELSSGLFIENITKSQDVIYRNNSYTDYQGSLVFDTTITAYVREAAVGPAEGANCSFYNSTSYLGSNLTSSSGYCNITFDPPDDTTPQNYIIYINATKSGYSSSDTNQTSFSVRGAIPRSNVNIIFPPYTPKLKLYRGSNSWFNSTIKDENYNSVIDATVRWCNSTSLIVCLNIGPIATGNGTDYGTIPINHPLGDTITIREHINKTHYDSPTPLPSQDIKVWGWSNVSILQPSSENINRGTNVNILCRVTDANTSESLSNYQVSFWNDSINIYNSNSNTTGYSNYTWNTSLVSVGPHNLNCTIPQNSTKYYDGAYNISFVNISLIGNLTASLVSVSETTVYRNNSYTGYTSPIYSTNITVNIADEHSNPVANANVSFYQNEVFLGYCPTLTDSTGNCTYNYNPSDNLAPNAYSIKFNATAQYYYASNTPETFIDVYGKLVPNITNYASKMYRNETYLLNSTTKDENGYYVDSVSGVWRLSGSSIGVSENISYTVSLTKTLGNYQLKYTSSKTYYDASDETNENVKNIQIWSKANVTLYSPLDATYNRGNSITYYANVTDLYNSSVIISNYNCSWWLDGSRINSSLTNSQGTCNWTWSTNCSNNVGSHVINSTIASDATTFYDPNINNSITTTTLIGNLSIRIDSPANNSVWHKTDSVWLNSTVNSECPSEPITSPTVNWTLNNTQNISTGVNYSWTISSDQSPGSYFINSTTNKTNYYSAYNTTNIKIWGWSNVTWIYPLTGNHSYGDILNLTCRVTDANNSTSISGYIVSFWRNESFVANNITYSGNATYLWNTTQYQPGLFVWKCNITDNSTLYYNASARESSASLILVDGYPPSIENLTTSPATLETNYNYTNITANITDNFGVDKVWARITLPNTTVITIPMSNNSIT